MAAEDASDLFSELAADQGHSNGIVCGWKAWLSTLPDEEADQWREAVAGDRFTLASMVRALGRREVSVGRSTLERHRNKTCRQCHL